MRSRATRQLAKIWRAAGSLDGFTEKPNCSLDSGLVPFEDAIQERDTILRVAGKIQLFVSHHQIDLSTVLIPNDGSLEEAFAAHYKLEIYIDHLGVDFIIAKYIFPNASLAEMMKHVITNYTSDSEENKREVTQNDYTVNQMVEWAEQEHFEDEETKLSCPKINLSTMLTSNKGSSDKSFQSLSYLHEMQKRKQKNEETKAVQNQDIKKHMY
ncbi:hypothetical protein Tco_0503471 [Tanacetum coccineum]